MKIIITLILISLLTGCLTATKQSTPPPEIATKCNDQNDPLKQTESIISPNIIADPRCNYYYRWIRTGKQGDGVYILELIYKLSRGRDGITEIRDLEGNSLKPIKVDFVDIKSSRDGVITTFRSLFKISEDFLSSVSESRKYQIYSGPRLAHEFSIQQGDIQGFLRAVDEKRSLK